MTQVINIENDLVGEILNEAAARHVLVVLSLRHNGQWMTHKSRMLQADSAARCLVIQHPLVNPGEAPTELVPDEKIGLSFRRGHKKCMFVTHIERLTNFELDEGQAVAALLVPFPENLQEMQRRLYHRAEVPAGRRIETMMWHGCALENDPAELSAKPHHVGVLLDISAGGCRIEMDASRNPHLEPGDSIGLQFQADPRGKPLRLDAMYRHCEDLSRGKIALGLQFVGLEMSPQGRQMLQALTRVVSTFLRIKSRREKTRLQRQRRRRQ